MSSLPFLFSLSVSCSLSPFLRIGEISLKWYKVTSVTHMHTHAHAHSLTHTHTHTHILTRHASVALAAQRTPSKPRPIHTRNHTPKYTWLPRRHTNAHTVSRTYTLTLTHACTHTQSSRLIGNAEGWRISPSSHNAVIESETCACECVFGWFRSFHWQ